jgi:hypothetical protein
MIKIIFLFFLIPTLYTASGQGQFAGTKTRPLIGKTYNNDRVLPGLPDYEYREVTLASDENDPEQFSVSVFQKGPTYVVLFTHNIDKATDDYIVLDVLVIKQVKKNQVVKTALCRQNKISNMEIVAVTQPGGSEFSPALRAWRFNRDKRRFEIASIKDIDCMNEGDD